MRSILSALDLVDEWSAGSRRAPFDGALALLARAEPAADLEGTTPGELDRALLELHAVTFASGLDAVASCPSCDEALDIAVDIDTLLATTPPPSSQRVVHVGSAHVEFRLPTVSDLRARPASGDALLDACVIAATVDGVAVEPGALPPAVRDAVEAAMQDGDPLAEIAVAMSCPRCAASWEEVLDPARFVWSAANDAARRLLADVVELATAFGWTEREILSLPAGRRRRYVDAVRAP